VAGIAATVLAYGLGAGVLQTPTVGKSPGPYRLTVEVRTPPPPKEELPQPLYVLPPDKPPEPPAIRERTAGVPRVVGTW
jgi:hypothetical protein